MTTARQKSRQRITVTKTLNAVSEVFFDIPAWANRLTLITNPLTPSAAGNVAVQFEVDGALVTTGYNGATTRMGASTLVTDALSGVAFVPTNATSPGFVQYINARFTKAAGELWNMVSVTGVQGTVSFLSGSIVELAKQPGRMRVYMTAGTMSGSATLIAEA
jgi:hypothetical protein